MGRSRSPTPNVGRAPQSWGCRAAPASAERPGEAPGRGVGCAGGNRPPGTGEAAGIPQRAGGWRPRGAGPLAQRGLEACAGPPITMRPPGRRRRESKSKSKSRRQEAGLGPGGEAAGRPALQGSLRGGALSARRQAGPVLGLSPLLEHDPRPARPPGPCPVRSSLPPPGTSRLGNNAGRVGWEIITGQGLETKRGTRGVSGPGALGPVLRAPARGCQSLRPPGATGTQEIGEPGFWVKLACAPCLWALKTKWQTRTPESSRGQSLKR